MSGDFKDGKWSACKKRELLEDHCSGGITAAKRSLPQSESHYNRLGNISADLL
ncbi:hypothetical protein HAX54_028655 [Datura stramonium]|uniref:Uncharacterized protein n=1 Tax=Datura stramonium TaxID=4076 RepID=A0ABS8V6P9_DATST|nr:hypothetical protein [Datura stramonium]